MVILLSPYFMKTEKMLICYAPLNTSNQYIMCSHLQIILSLTLYSDEKMLNDLHLQNLQNSFGLRNKQCIRNDNLVSVAVPQLAKLTLVTWGH